MNIVDLQNLVNLAKVGLAARTESLNGDQLVAASNSLRNGEAFLSHLKAAHEEKVKAEGEAAAEAPEVEEVKAEVEEVKEEKPKKKTRRRGKKGSLPEPDLGDDEAIKGKVVPVE